jgi:prepilin-type N-terminal cleavage/methylation domain-containing protein
MPKETRTVADRQRGLSLVELLVAMTITALALVVTLTVYDGAKRSYHRGEIASEQQQTGRIAFDLITHEIWLAGLNLFPDGDHYRPDEPIEAAGERYLVLRADFDGDDPARSDVPELGLSNGAYVYGTVSTGNDEIHGFVLAHALPDGTAAGPDGFAFDADVGDAVRDGVVETVTVDNVVLTPAGAPYTLYRLSLDNDASRFGSPGFVNRTPLADNVRSLRFRYFDLAGNEILAPGGTDDEAGRRARAAIARIGVELEVLPRHDTPNGMRPAKPFLLTGDVSPRNRDKIRIVDNGAAQWEPGRVGTPTRVAGHCGGLLVSWPPSPAHDRVAYYRIYTGTDPLNLDHEDSWVWPSCYIGGLVDGEEYTVRVAAVNTGGIEGEQSPPMSRRAQNYNVPASPDNLRAAEERVSRIGLSWDAVTRNTFDVPEAALRDLAGYRIYRSTSSGLAPGPAQLYADRVPQPAWIDSRAVSCRTYYYVVTAVDDCDLESAPSAEVTESTRSQAELVPPAGVRAFFDGSDVRLSWDRVRDDVDGTEVWVEDYRVFRAGPVPQGSEPPAVPFDFMEIETVRGAIEFREPRAEPGYEYWYTVQAFDDCSNRSGYSEPATASCSFQGDVRFEWPGHAGEYSPYMYVEVRVAGAAGVYEELRLTFRNEEDGTVYHETLSGPGPVWTYTMRRGDEGPFTTGWYTIEAEVDQFDGESLCTEVSVTRARLQ